MARNEARYRAAEDRLWKSVGLSPTERTVELRDRARVRLQEVGEGQPLLFVHGTGSGGGNWAPLIAELDGFRCIALDRPGCGLSEPAFGGQRFQGMDDFNAYADSLLVEVLDGLGLPRATIVATSFGSYFALRGAAMHPDRLMQLVGFAHPFGAPIEKVPMAMRVATIPGMEAMTSRIPPTRPAVKMILRQLGLKRAMQNGRFSGEMFDWFFSLLRDTETLRADQRATPQLITRGESAAQAFSEQLPNATLHVVPEAGHAPWIDEPTLSAHLMRDFLAT